MLSLKIPNPSPRLSPPTAASPSPSSSMAFCVSSSLRFDSIALHRRSFISQATPPIGLTPKTLAVSFTSPRTRISLSRLIVALAASHEESNPSDIEVEKEGRDVRAKAEESEEAWKQTLAAFKEQATMMQSLSQEAYEIYSKKAMVVLKETSEQLKIQAEKARNDLADITKEISEEGREYISAAAQNSPEDVKEIVETFSSSTDDYRDMSRVPDFRLGIPYGLLLTVTGFLSFMLYGSIDALRFGVILGGAVLALSIQSLKSYKRGEPPGLALKGQAAIVAVLFLRELRLLLQGTGFLKLVSTALSGAMLAFYCYRIIADRKQRRDLEPGAEN